MHRLTGAGAYMVTCGTYLKLHHFQGTERLRYLSDYLLRLAGDYQWDLQACVSTGIKGAHFHQFEESQEAPELVPAHTLA